MSILQDVERVCRFVSPSARPVSDERWRALQQELGLTLPADYLELVNRFGDSPLAQLRISSTIGGQLSLYNPFGQSTSSSISWSELATCYNDFQERGTHVPYEAFPKCPGLLPCAFIGDFDMINWVTSEDPDAWRVVFYSDRNGFSDFGSISLAGLIADLLEGKVQIPPPKFSSSNSVTHDAQASLKAGDRVRVLEGQWRDKRARVVAVDHLQRIVTVGFEHFGTEILCELPVAYLKTDVSQ